MQTFIKTFGFAYRHLFSVLFSSVSRYLVLGHGWFIKFSLKTQVYMHIDQSYVFPIQTAHLQQTEWIVSHWG